MRKQAVGAITGPLQEWAQGDRIAADTVFALVYDRLQALAARHLRRERRGITLEAGALVHELFIRLSQEPSLHYEGRAQFFSFSAHLMRRILVDHARTRGRAKRGGQAIRLTLGEVAEIGQARPPDLVALDDALSDLAALDSRKAQVVELRYFGGLTLAETAEHLGISPETVSREWRQARAWLHAALSRDV